jgi:molecular chaperone DnaJ
MATGDTAGSRVNCRHPIFATGMELKDYYAILELEPRAGYPEIRKAYRRLAMLLHPDKNPGDPYARARFEEIREAYEVLTDPRKKEYYLQQRWYSQQAGNRRPSPPLTPVTFLKQILELDRYVANLDQFRMDQHGLQHHILELLSDSRIEQLNGFREIAINDEITSIFLRCFRSLSFPLLGAPLLQLGKIEVSQHILLQVNTYFTTRQKNDRWEKYKPWAILLLVVSVCILIFFTQ